jgi:hypothetical protein
MTLSRTRWPSRSRISGAGTVPLRPIARNLRPSMVIDCRAMVSVMSSPDTVGSAGRIPGEIVCAQAGSQADNAAPPPARAAPRRNWRRSRAEIIRLSQL